MKDLKLKCLEEEDIVLVCSPDEANDGAPGVMVTFEDDDRGVLLSARSVDRLVTWLQSWQGKNV